VPRIDYPQPVVALIAQLKRLPGIGPRSAERIALWLLADRAEATTELAAALQSARDEVTWCDTCGFFASRSAGCPVCNGPRRDPGLLCVVEQATDVLPLERSGAYRGQYHVLGGRLAPLDGIGPEQLRVASLANRVKSGHFHEVILALSADVEGEATANFVSDLLRPTGVTITRLAQGLPAGGGLEHADPLTLTKALDGRR
jgi:recombination protein RecR